MLKTIIIISTIGSYLLLMGLIEISSFNAYANPVISPYSSYLIQSFKVNKEDCLNYVNIITNVIQQKISQTKTMSLQITTDKKIYGLAEPITITIKNNGNESLIFSDASLNLSIKNIETGENYRLVAAQVLTELKPNESRTLKWDSQRDGNAKVGNFSASTASGIYSANTSFSITK